MDSTNPRHDDQEQAACGKEDSRHACSRYTPTMITTILISVILGIIVLLPLLTAVGIFGFQVWFWAKHGSWTVVPFARFATWVGLPPADWFTPESWVGIAKIVQTVFRLPAALVLFVLSTFCAVFGGIFQRR